MAEFSDNITTEPDIDMTGLEWMWTYCPASIYIDRSITPIFYVIGVPGNILAAIIWLSRRMRKNNTSAIYLAALSISDLVFLMLYVLQELQVAWHMKVLGVPVLCETYYMVSLTAQYLSPTLSLGFTIERYIAICHPFLTEKYCTKKRAIMAVIISILCCLLFGAMQCYLYTYDPDDPQICRIREEALVTRNNLPSLWEVWSWLTEMTFFLAIPLVNLVFNCLVIAEVHRLAKAERSRSHGMVVEKSENDNSGGAATTLMLLCVSFYVIITTLPSSLIYVVFTEFNEGREPITDSQIRVDPVWQRHFKYLIVRRVIDEICLSHYACNIILYLITGAQFRAEVVRLLRRMVGLPPRKDKYMEVARG